MSGIEVLGPKFRDITKQCTFSWATAPTAITAGIFPDSFTDGNHETKLEFYGTYAGAGLQARMQISSPKPRNIILMADIASGAQIGGDGDMTRSVFFDTSIYAERYPVFSNKFLETDYSTSFSIRLRNPYNSVPNGYSDTSRIMFHAAGAGDYAWEIYSIRILEIVGV